MQLSPLFIIGLAILIFQAIFWAARVRDTFRSLLRTPVVEPAHRLPDHESGQFPLVSVIVPAHNEEENIAGCLKACLDQDYPNIEILLVDDRSQDSTLDIARHMEAKDSRLKVIRVDTLAPGWTGKCHAVDVGYHASQGQWLVFLDADSVMEPSCIRACYDLAREKDVSMVTLSPAPILKTFWEKAVQPIFMGMSSILFPLERINDPNDPIASANGMFFLISKQAYEAIGGHHEVKDLAVEDIGIGKRVKAKGLGLIFANGRKILKTRMYTGVRQTLDGWIRIHSASINYSLPKAISLFVSHTMAGARVTIIAFVLYVPYAMEVWPVAWTILPLLILAQINIVSVFFYPQLGIPARYSLLLPIGNIMLSVALATIVKRIACKDPLMWRGTVYETSRYEPRDLDPSNRELQ